MTLNVPDFSLEDFIQLRNALKKLTRPPVRDAEKKI